MKIFIISENYPPYIEGGAEISTSLLAEWLAKKNTVSVACSRVAKKPWTENGVVAYPIIFKASIGSGGILAAFRYVINLVIAPLISSWRILRLIRQLDPDVINVVITLYYFVPIILLMRIFVRRPIFLDCRDYSLICPLHFRNNEIEDPKHSHHGYRCLMAGYNIKNNVSRICAVPFAIYESFIFNLYKSSLRFTINNFSGITLVPLSNYVGQQLVLNGFRGDKIVVIPNISKTAEKAAVINKSEIPIFAYAGRIEKEKGIWDLIAAVELLKKRARKPFLLKVAGTGSAYESVHNYLQTTKSLPIVLLGKIVPSKVLELYQGSLAIVAPSRWPEPFGRFIQESISVGTPVIATRAGGVTEGIQDGTTGLLVEVGNVSQLAEAMKSFLDDDGKSERMGSAAMKEHIHYDADVIGQRRMELYRGKARL